MTNGVITGGWEYVIAAYSITSLVFAAYAISLWVRGNQIAKALPPPETPLRSKEGP